VEEGGKINKKIILGLLWKVAGSNPDEMDFFNLPNPSSRTMALGSTQPLTEMSIGNLPVCK
jgi:hypothetical protein